MKKKQSWDHFLVTSYRNKTEEDGGAKEDIYFEFCSINLGEI